MTIPVKRTTTRKKLSALLKGKKRTRKNRGVDVVSFGSKLKLDGDPLEVQKRMRDGWN
jgi:hypothetical protein